MREEAALIPPRPPIPFRTSSSSSPTHLLSTRSPSSCVSQAVPNPFVLHDVGRWWCRLDIQLMFVPLAHSLPSPLCPVSMGFRTTIIISATSLLLGASCPAQGFDWRTGSLTLLVRTSRSAAVFRPTSQLSSGSSCQSLTCYREHVHPLDRSGLVAALKSARQS